MATGTADADAPASRRTPVAVALPVVLITAPFEAIVPEKSIRASTPDAGSTKPVDATSRCLIDTEPWNGVCARSLKFSGPASPSSAIVPSPGAFPDTVNGNADVNDRFDTFTSTSL